MTLPSLHFLSRQPSGGQPSWLLPIALVLLAACSGSHSSPPDATSEDKEAKALLQGIWVDDESGDISFRAKGDTIYYPDSTSQPAYFRIVDDSLELGQSHTRYSIVKQSAHLFWFENQNGDVVKLVKSDDQETNDAFVSDTPRTMVYTQVVKHDSVVMHAGERYHWYTAINPTKYRVFTKSYNDDGVEVENVYFDNIIHISLYQGARQIFSRDFRKQMYKGKVPQQFLNQAVLGAMDYAGADASGFHFHATLCIPGGATCYIADNTISPQGKLTTTIIEY